MAKKNKKPSIFDDPKTEDHSQCFEVTVVSVIPGVEHMLRYCPLHDSYFIQTDAE